jgi:7,8-dihydropterin-6-yl-methyl-4-(beta-D-ribofuranosyl)aminobenzene 5'-phosphate synthase
MEVSVLIEDRSSDKELTARHGIALAVEAGGTTVLFDAGPNTMFLDNAVRMGKDLKQVSFAVVSHGHYDHGGGLKGFCALNTHAPIYLHRKAVEDEHIALVPGKPQRDVGFTAEGCGERLVFVDELCSRTSTGVFSPKEGFLLFGDFPADGFVPSGNRLLYSRAAGEEPVPDDFSHEIAMLVTEGDTVVLITGCSHSGIGNMVRRASRILQGKDIDAVIGGFHLIDSAVQNAQAADETAVLAEELKAYPRTRFFTGHCTGEKSYHRLKELMGAQIDRFETGTRCTF